MKDNRVPKVSKILLGAALAYIVSPVDIIPDFIPILGQLDDLIIVPFLIFLAVSAIPKKIIAEYRSKEK